MKTLSLEKIIFILILCRPIITIIDGVFSGVGIILSTILSLLLILFIIKNKLHSLNWLLLIALIFTISYDLFLSKDYFIAIRDSLKLFLFSLIIILSSLKQFRNSILLFLKKNSKYFSYQINIICILTGILLLNSNFYQYTYGEKVFVGLYDHPHTLAYSMLLVITYGILIFKIDNNRNKKHLFLLLIPFVAIFMSGARTASIVAIAFISLFIDDYYRLLKYMLVFIIFVPFINLQNVPFIQKFITSAEMGMVTSGRDVIWQLDINYFINSSLGKQLLGNGIDFSYVFHRETIGRGLWSHNDYINLLLTTGLVGLITYIVFILEYILNIRKQTNLLKTMILLGIILVLSNGNGMYLYTDFVINLLLITLVFNFNKYIKE